MFRYKKKYMYLGLQAQKNYTSHLIKKLNHLDNMVASYVNLKLDFTDWISYNLIIVIKLCKIR